MFGGWSKNKKTENEQALEWKLERCREQERRQGEEDSQRSREEAKRMRERIEENLRSADSWPEALRKQAHLYSKEARQYTPDDEPDDYFGSGAEACERALVIGVEGKQSRHVEVDEIQKRLDAIQEEIRLAVADRLMGESENPNWREVASAIRSGDYWNWLNW